ncbi:MAG TPA: cbb3-type cytochrome c oxidase N-terminal domain-containing protein [Chitinophagaceae bacterium]
MRKVRIYIILVLALLVVLFGGVAAWNQGTTTAAPVATTTAETAAAVAKKAPAAFTSAGNLLYIIVGVLLVMILSMVISIYFRVNKLMKHEFANEPPLTLGQWWASLNQRVFTKAVPVEKEEDILLDHDYDGIKELDNSLPPWWKWGFYFTIVVAVVYFVRFHVVGSGPTPEEEYNTEMKIAAAQMEELRKSSGEMVDEKTVTMADAAGIAEGKQIFQKSCFMCHGSNGEGGVGPNLTDEYWIHGGSINDVFKTIKYGVIDKGMQAWEKQFSPTELKNLTSYIKSIQGTNPANAKAPQGDVYKETATAGKDTTAPVDKGSISMK